MMDTLEDIALTLDKCQGYSPLEGKMEATTMNRNYVRLPNNKKNSSAVQKKASA